MSAIREAGGTVHYIPVNMTDVAAVRSAITIVRERSGRIDVLLHAAGVERSHLLPDKSPEEFDLVFDVKVGGFINLLRAIGDMPLGAIVAFSSVAGRFGNAGQTDYSAANDTLCKIISSLRTTRPGTRGIAIDWTAWAGIGMATRGSIPKLMEVAGIDMSTPEAGIPVIRRELRTGDTRGEVVIAKRLGVMTEELDDSGGLEILSSGAVATHGPMIGVIRSARINDGLIVETTLCPKEQPFLRDHQIQGTPVLPGVMGMESFAEISRIMLPGWNVTGLEDVNFLAPFKFYKDEPRILTLRATVSSRDEDAVADCCLIGRRQLKNDLEPQETTHFTARVLLCKKSLKKSVGESFSAQGGALIDAEEIYRLYFHGPAYRVVKQAWRDEQRMVGELASNLPIDHYPADSPILISPRLIELCFQTAGLWEIATKGRFGLPQHVDSVRFYGAPVVNNPLYAIITPDEVDGTFRAEVADASGNCYLELTGYRTVAIPAVGDEQVIKRLQDAFRQEHLQAA